MGGGGAAAYYWVFCFKCSHIHVSTLSNCSELRLSMCVYVCTRSRVAFVFYVRAGRLHPKSYRIHSECITYHHIPSHCTNYSFIAFQTRTHKQHSLSIRFGKKLRKECSAKKNRLTSSGMYPRLRMRANIVYSNRYFDTTFTIVIADCDICLFVTVCNMWMCGRACVCFVSIEIGYENWLLPHTIAT